MYYLHECQWRCSSSPFYLFVSPLSLFLSAPLSFSLSPLSLFLSFPFSLPLSSFLFSFLSLPSALSLPPPLSLSPSLSLMFSDDRFSHTVVSPTSVPPTVPIVVCNGIRSLIYVCCAGNKCRNGSCFMPDLPSTRSQVDSQGRMLTLCRDKIYIWELGDTTTFGLSL